MGNTCCTKNRKLSKKIVLLLVGLDNAGKTATAKGLAGEPLESVLPTVGFSIINLRHLGHKITLYDLGGGVDIRNIWHLYFADAHGVIFVIDSSDFLRLEEVKSVLQNLLSHEKISGKPLLILANKQDYKDALDEVDVVEKLDLELLVNDKQCPTLVEPCIANDNNYRSALDSGIKKGYDWLVNYITRNYDSLNNRVEMDVRRQEIMDQQLRLDKIERLKCKTETPTTSLNDTIEYSEQYMKDEKQEITKQLDSQKLERLKCETEILATLNDKKEYVENSSEDHRGCLQNQDKSCYKNINNILTSKSNNFKRSKSATYMVREQLELGYSYFKPSLKFTRANKIVPINLYGGDRQSRSADGGKQKMYENCRDNNKSDFWIKQLSNVNSIPGPSGDKVQELYELNNFDKKLLLSESSPISTKILNVKKSNIVADM